MASEPPAGLNTTLPEGEEAAISVRDLKMAYGSFVVMDHITFDVRPGKVLIIMGPSGCGKSTLLKYLIGLKGAPPGKVLHRDADLNAAKDSERSKMMQRFGVLFQNGALWSSMTLAENVAIPLERYTDLSKKDIAEVASLKLQLVGLKGFENFYPSEISGGMRKRAGLARAMALDPEVLFFDEPSAGLDPITSKRLDDLILQLRDGLGTTVVVVTHELPSLFAIGDLAIYLDVKLRTMSAWGNPIDLMKNPPNERVGEFLTRGGHTDESGLPSL